MKYIQCLFYVLGVHALSYFLMVAGLGTPMTWGSWLLNFTISVIFGVPTFLWLVEPAFRDQDNIPYN